MAQTAVKLTKRLIETLTCQPGKGETLYWDTEIKGFGVRVRASGTKSYVVQRYIKGTRETARVTLEYVNVLSLEEARQRAIQIIANYFSVGLNPKKERRRQHEAAKIQNFTLRQAVEEYISGHPRTRASTKAGYQEDIERYCEDWLDMPLTAITTDMVLTRHTAIQTGVAIRAQSNRATGYTSANKTMRAIRAVWNYAIAAERVPPQTTNPITKFTKLGKWYPERQRSFFVQPDQIKPFIDAVDALTNRPAATYFKLLLFTGLRDEEARSLQWAQVDFNDAMIRLSAEQTKANRHLDLPMSDYIVDLLRQWKTTAVSSYVFPGEFRDTYMYWPAYSLERLREKTGMTELSPHILRHTFRTHAKLIGVPDSTASELLNHSKGGSVTARYDHTGADVLRQPMQRIADHFKGLLGLPIATTVSTTTDMEAVIRLAERLGKDGAALRAFFEAA